MAKWNVTALIGTAGAIAALGACTATTGIEDSPGQTREAFSIGESEATLDAATPPGPDAATLPDPDAGVTTVPDSAPPPDTGASDDASTVVADSASPVDATIPPGSGCVVLTPGVPEYFSVDNSYPAYYPGQDLDVDPGVPGSPGFIVSSVIAPATCLEVDRPTSPGAPPSVVEAYFVTNNAAHFAAHLSALLGSLIVGDSVTVDTPDLAGSAGDIVSFTLTPSGLLVTQDTTGMHDPSPYPADPSGDVFGMTPLWDFDSAGDNQIRVTISASYDGGGSSPEAGTIGTDFVRPMAPVPLDLTVTPIPGTETNSLVAKGYTTLAAAEKLFGSAAQIGSKRGDIINIKANGAVGQPIGGVAAVHTTAARSVGFLQMAYDVSIDCRNAASRVLNTIAGTGGVTSCTAWTKDKDGLTTNGHCISSQEGGLPDSVQTYPGTVAGCNAGTTSLRVTTTMKRVGAGYRVNFGYLSDDNPKRRDLTTDAGRKLRDEDEIQAGMVAAKDSWLICDSLKQIGGDAANGGGGYDFAKKDWAYIKMKTTTRGYSFPLPVTVHAPDPSLGAAGADPVYFANADSYFIVHHPAGLPKKLTYYSDAEDAANTQYQTPRLQKRMIVNAGRGAANTMFYRGDTLPGSSGSPVFWVSGTKAEAMGLHHGWHHDQAPPDPAPTGDWNEAFWVKQLPAF